MPSIFDRVDDLIDDYLGLKSGAGKPPRFEHKTNFRHLLSDPPSVEVLSILFAAIIQKIDQNWHEAGRPQGSKHNWRLEPQFGMSEANPSNEKTLEKAILQVNPGCWVNQVPVAAGLVTGVGDNSRAIDLVEINPDGSFDFIELKITSEETPGRAIFEILKYGIAWVFCRRNHEHLACKDQPLMLPDQVRLVVLADVPFFMDGDVSYPLIEFENVIRNALSQAFEGIHLDFALQQFPHEFNWSASLQLSTSELSQALDSRTGLNGN